MKSKALGKPDYLGLVNRLTKDEFRALGDKMATENDVLEHVLTHARLRRWLAYHTHDSRHSQRGFLDVTLLRPPRLIVAELKTMAGKLTVEQQEWLDQWDAFAEAVTGVARVETYVWRPCDFDTIAEVLA